MPILDPMGIYLGLIEPSSNLLHTYEQSKFATSYDHFVQGGCRRRIYLHEGSNFATLYNEFRRG